MNVALTQWVVKMITECTVIAVCVWGAAQPQFQDASKCIFDIIHELSETLMRLRCRKFDWRITFFHVWPNTILKCHTYVELLVGVIIAPVHIGSKMISSKWKFTALFSAQKKKKRFSLKFSQSRHIASVISVKQIKCVSALWQLCCRCCVLGKTCMQLPTWKRNFTPKKEYNFGKYNIG